MSMIMILEAVADEAAVQHVERATIPFRPLAGWGLDMFDSPEDSDDEWSENSISLEKAWHGLHFLLTGDPWGGHGWPAFLLCGGSEQGEDMGYGPARIFDAEEVQEIAVALGNVSDQALWSRFNRERMADADIYGADWSEEPEEELREEFTHYFRRLKEFIASTASDGNSLRIIMT